MHNRREIDFLTKHVAGKFSYFALVVNCHWNVDPCSQHHRRVMKLSMAGRFLESSTSLWLLLALFVFRTRVWQTPRSSKCKF